MLASPGLGHIAYVGGDEHTTGINNNPINGTACSSTIVCGDMYNLAAILSLASSPPYNLRVLFTESWLPSWAPLTSAPTDGNAYEGLAKCDWQTFDLIRQTLAATTMWASANGLSEVNFFHAVDLGTVCVYTTGPVIPATVGNDRFSPPSTYLTGVVRLAPASQRSKTFYWLQQLINNWMAIVASGQALQL
jgi:hypothetical protein